MGYVTMTFTEFVMKRSDVWRFWVLLVLTIPRLGNDHIPAMFMWDPTFQITTVTETMRIDEARTQRVRATSPSHARRSPSKTSSSQTPQSTLELTIPLAGCSYRRNACTRASTRRFSVSRYHAFFIHLSHNASSSARRFLPSTTFQDGGLPPGLDTRSDEALSIHEPVILDLSDD